MSIRKASLQEFQHQIKDVRSQLVDQIKCLEQRTDVQVSILHEVNDFLKKRAEIDLEYSKQLDKLVKSVMLKHKNEKQKRANWSLYSTCSLWQQLVDDTKEEAKQRGITAEVYGNHIIASVSTRCAALQKISKKCREIGVLAQGEVVRVIDELFAAMKTYQLCYAEYSVMNAKLQQAEAEKTKTQESNSTRKQRSVQKNFDKKSVKFEASRLKCNRARNEYLLSIEAANASLHKFFADDLADLIDCTDLGMEYWLNLILTNIISARKAACQTEMNSLANLGTFKDSLQPQLDKQKFFESNSSIFMLPKRFEFKCDVTETINTISLGEGLSEELKQRHYQMRKRLERLRLESDESWRVLSQTEQQIKDILSAATLLEITEHGIADHRPPEDTLESELAKSYESYLPSFRFYLLNANLIVRLEARADGIGNALVKSNISLNNTFSEDGGSGGGVVHSVDGEDFVIGSDVDWHEQARRKKRIGSQASAATGDSSNGVVNGGGSLAQGSPLRCRRPRLFGGSLEEYVELTGEKIPLIVTSCIRVLSQFALHHQGVFRVSGSQVEINHMKEAFENGDDPLRDVQDASDVNSIAGVLKLYFRELSEPLFPFYLFELLTECAKCSSTAEFINQISPLLYKLPRPTYLLLRYLFAFLNHLSEFSDENMMDPYNLAICFGPTLLPIPEGKDQVYYQNYVNEVVKNLIVHHDIIFTARVTGPRYEKYDIINAGTNTSADNNNEIELFVDDVEYFGSNATGTTTTGDMSLEGGNSVPNGTLNSADFFDYRNYAEELLKNPYNFQNSEHLYPPQPQPLSSGGELMNASTISVASSGLLGLGNYNECLPPSITATLVKPPAFPPKTTKLSMNAKFGEGKSSSAATASASAVDSSGICSENGDESDLASVDDGESKVTPRPSGIVKPACVVEEADLDSFLCSQHFIRSSPSPMGDAATATQQLRQKLPMRSLQTSSFSNNNGESSGGALGLQLNRGEHVMNSTCHEPAKSGMDKTSADLKTVELATSHKSLRDGPPTTKSHSERRESKSRTRDSSRKRDPQHFPPPSPKQKHPNEPQYSQPIAKNDRIRIPIVPETTSVDPQHPNEQPYSTLNKQSTAYYHRVHHYGTSGAIPPSYDALYGASATVTNKNSSDNNGGVPPDDGKKSLPSSPSTPNPSTGSTLNNSRSGSASGGFNSVGPSSRSNSSMSTNTTTTRTQSQKQEASPTIASRPPVMEKANNFPKTNNNNNNNVIASKSLPGTTTVTSSRQVVVGSNLPTRKSSAVNSVAAAINAMNSAILNHSVNVPQKTNDSQRSTLANQGHQQPERSMSSPTKRPNLLISSDAGSRS